MARVLTDFGKSLEKRNSNIEFLRIVSMIFIICSHFTDYSVGDLSLLPRGTQILLNAFFSAMGKIGVFLFLSISVWFLADKALTLKSSMKRVWLLERELLFYSVLTVAAQLIIEPSSVDVLRIVKAFFPLLAVRWWYMSSFALLLLCLPFLLQGLKALSSRQHLTLVLGSLVIASIFPYLPWVNGLLKFFDEDDFINFLMVAVLITYCRWNISFKMLGKYRGVLGALTILGFVIKPVLNIAKNNSEGSWASVLGRLYISYGNTFSFLVIFAALPLFLSIVSLKERKSKVINLFAQGSAAVYLVSETTQGRKVLWETLFTYDHLREWGGAGESSVFLCILIIICIYFVISLFDVIRELAFRLVLKNPGALFDRLVPPIAAKMNVWIDSLQKKIEKPSEISH